MIYADEKMADLRASARTFQNMIDTAGNGLSSRIARDTYRALLTEIERRREEARQRMVTEYNAYARQQPSIDGRDFLSRGDALEAAHHPDTTPAQREWLDDFGSRWDAPLL